MGKTRRTGPPGRAEFEKLDAMASLRLQQALVDAPLTNLKADSVRSFISNLCSRFGLPADGDLSMQFFALLSAVFEASLGFWICDYVAIVCADRSYSSSDPEEFHVLQPAAVLAWADSSAQQLHKRVLGLFQNGAAPDRIIDLGHSTKTLLSVVQAVHATLGSSHTAQNLCSTLQLLHDTTQVLQWLEQQQQQRPGMAPPLISRSASANRLSGLGGPKPCPHYDSLAAWQARLAGERQAAAGGRLFLDDLIDKLLLVSGGQRPVAYPFSDVLGAVEALFMSGSSSKAAWRCKLALLLYYLLDGGWLNSSVPFAQGFQMSLTLVQQWECHYLMDKAAAAMQDDSSRSGALDVACNLLGAIACPETPFRFVEALLAAGRPTTALAVQRARCATSSVGGGGSGSSAAMSLSEAQVLLRVQLGCGLLAEAFSELRRHCSQLQPPQRARHVKALMQQLADWATEEQHQQSTVGLSRLQQVAQLPLNSEEEAALLGWCRQRFAAGQPGAHMLPLYLLQRGRSLEALSAYAEYCASPAGTAAAAAAGAGAAGSSAAAAVLYRQLQTLMAAAAAALPPSLRATATAASKRTLGAIGNSTAADAAEKGSLPVVTLQYRGVEPPVFLSALIPAVPAGSGLKGSSAGLSVEGLTLDGNGTEPDEEGSAAAPAAAQAAGLHAAAPTGFRGSLFADEVLAEAGPGSVALDKPQGLAGSTAQQAAAGGMSGDYVPLLFGTPAPAPAPAAGRAAAAGEGPGLFGGTEAGLNPAGGFSMTEAEFGRDVLGINRPGDAAAPAAAATPAPVGQYAGERSSRSRRSSKRQRQTPATSK